MCHHWYCFKKDFFDIEIKKDVLDLKYDKNCKVIIILFPELFNNIENHQKSNEFISLRIVRGPEFV